MSSLTVRLSRGQRLRRPGRSPASSASRLISSRSPSWSTSSSAGTRTDRCYHCKKISAVHLRKRARELAIAVIADGINVSDTGEHRPGLAASTEEGILHPFIEAGCTKQDIRDIARECGLPVWQKPSAACLSSRIPYGDSITTEKLRMIEEAEAFLAAQGFGQLRVRLHGNIARIEGHKEEMGRILDQQAAKTGALKTIGFSYVTLDLEGYRSGSMDEVLNRMTGTPVKETRDPMFKKIPCIRVDGETFTRGQHEVIEEVPLPSSSTGGTR